MDLRCAILLICAVTTACAQTKREAPGTLTGHVFCADTQRPARLAGVQLLRVPIASDIRDTSKTGGPELSANLSEVVETSLDGSFTLTNIKPGRYFLVIEKRGYLDPIAYFTAKQLVSNDVTTRRLVAESLHEINVAAGETVHQEVSLERGAGISGTATYDDGTPAAGLEVTLLAKDTEGKWNDRLGREYRTDFGFLRTDDLGHFRTTGLPPGEYLIKIDLALNKHTTSTFPSPENPTEMITMYSTQTKFSLPLFTGNVWREKMAVPVSLGRAEEKSNVDLQFPLNKLHPVSGRALAKDGHPINDATVAVLYPDDKKKVIESKFSLPKPPFRWTLYPRVNTC